jgi:hypothetical protein
MKLVGANPEPGAIGLEELPEKTNYFIGNEPVKWAWRVAVQIKKIGFGRSEALQMISLLAYCDQAQGA